VEFPVVNVSVWYICLVEKMEKLPSGIDGNKMAQMLDICLVGGKYLVREHGRMRRCLVPPSPYRGGVPGWKPPPPVSKKIKRFQPATLKTLVILRLAKFL
jgi:hypothetical protein